VLVNIPCVTEMEEQRPLNQIFHRQVRGPDFKVLDHLKWEVEGGGPVNCVSRRKNAVLINVVRGVRAVSFSVTSSNIANL
jgi:hypothetical protein